MYLPEPQTPYTATAAGQPLTPTQIVPAAEQHLAPAPPPGMRVVGYQRIHGTELLEPIYGPLYEPPPPLPPVPPSLDPVAQRTAARGVLAAGVGWGGGQLLIGAGQLVNAIVAGGTVLLWGIGAFVVARITAGLAVGRGPTINKTTHVHNHNRWLGRSTTRVGE